MNVTCIVEVPEFDATQPETTSKSLQILEDALMLEEQDCGGAPLSWSKR